MCGATLLKFLKEAILELGQFLVPCRRLGGNPRRDKEATMILIVDDDEGMTEICSMYLESRGFDVSVASSGDEALSKIRSGAHELVISDCAMPGMSGIELSERLKSNPSTAQLPILLMSASLRCEIAIGSSYDGFLRKPFLAENLLEQVQKLLAPACAGRNDLSKV